MRVARTSATLRRSEPCRSDFQLTSETLSPGSRRTACGVGRAPAPVAVAASGRKLQAGRPPGACGPRCRCGELCGCLTSEWNRLGASARLERGRGFPRYQNARRGLSPGRKTARIALTRLCWVTVVSGQRFSGEDLAQRSVQACISTDHRAERSRGSPSALSGSTSLPKFTDLCF